MIVNTQIEPLSRQNSPISKGENAVFSSQINVANICDSTRALGPGLRSVVWVQGCPFHCRGCIAPGWLPFRTASLMSPNELADWLLRNPEVTGVTFSGGEPMLQAEGLAQAARLIRKKRDVDLICFSGYKYETLLNHPPSPGVRDFLEQLDVLIDGPYIQSHNSGTGLRGSKNQRILRLSGRLMGVDLENSPRRVELRIDRNDLVVVGIPPRNASLTLGQMDRFFQE